MQIAVSKLVTVIRNGVAATSAVPPIAAACAAARAHPRAVVAATAATLAAGTGAALVSGRGAGTPSTSLDHPVPADPLAVARPRAGSPSTVEPAGNRPIAPVDSPPAARAGKVLRVGDQGPEVAALKRQLGQLRYAVDDGDVYTRQTRDAVMAFQKVNGLLPRDGIAGVDTRRALLDPLEPQLASNAYPDRIDVDLSSQVLVVVRGGKADYIVNATTGNPGSADGKGIATPTGAFRVHRKVEEVRNADLGPLYWPSYFHRGVAVHGSPGITGWPSSHGCVRVPRWLEQRIHVDMPVDSVVVVHE